MVTQVALAFVLLAGSGLMLRTISQLLSVDVGFDPKNVLTTGVGLSPAVTSDPARIRTAWKEILARVSAIPGVESGAINISLPLQGEESVQYSVGPGGASGDPLRFTRVGTPTLDYWKAMRIPLVRGRLFTEQDTATSALVVIIDELLAANAFPVEDPVGKQLNLQHFGSARVVGVVRHLRYSALDEDVSGTSKEQVYVPFEQLPDAFLRPLAPGMGLVLRTSVNPASIQQSLRQAVARTGLDQPVHNVVTMEQIIGGSLAERRLVLQMLGIFGGLALALASVGIAGVVSYTMSRRLREIAIRIALGARPQQVLRLAMGQAMTMVALGVGVGLAAWLALMQIISSWLYKVTPTDPVTLAGVAVMLSAVTLAATYLPAHRSLCVDPVDVLRLQ